MQQAQPLDFCACTRIFTALFYITQL